MSARKQTVVVGINFSHDSAAAVSVDGEIVSATSLERTSRIKRGIVPYHLYAGQITKLIAGLLDENKLNFGDVDYWVGASTEIANHGEESQLLDLLGYPIPAAKRLQMPTPSHHLAHASSAVYSSGFGGECAALVVDAYGSLSELGREQESGFVFEHGREPQKVVATYREEARIAGTISREGTMIVPRRLQGIGEIYRVISLALGFFEQGTAYDDAGKTMGLAAYGSPLSEDRVIYGGEQDTVGNLLLSHGYARETCNSELLELIPRAGRKQLGVADLALAAQLQYEFENEVLELARELLARANTSRVALSGGCFLNAQVNAKLVSELHLEEIFIYPAATDDGTAVGAALYAHHNLVPRSESVALSKTKEAVSSVTLGRKYSDTKDIVDECERLGLLYRKHGSTSDAESAAASAMARGDIVAWFDGRSEFGPRALGSRSILCHPGLTGMKDKLNSRIKFREAFRPFAASVLLEKCEEWFHMLVSESPFMMFALDVRSGVNRDLISEVLHVDGSCRLQTLSVNDTNAVRLRRVVETFSELTDIPMVLNTSLNLRGCPMAETPLDAIDCMLGSRLDRTFIGPVEVSSPDFASFKPIAAACLPNGSQISDIVESGLSVGDFSLAQGTVPFDDVLHLVLEARRSGLVRWENDVSKEPARIKPQYMF